MLFRRPALGGLALLAALLFASLIICSAPAANLVSYQGKLFDSQGQPLTGSHSITFSVYDAASGGSPLWQETQSVTLGGDGVYSVLLGSVTPMPAGLFQGDDRYLGIAVNGEELSPRAYVGFAPQALMAASLPAGAVTGDNIADQAVTSANLADDAVTGDKLADDAVTSSKIAAGAVGSSEVVDNSLTSDDLAAGSVGTSELASGAVTTYRIADGAVTSIKRITSLYDVSAATSFTLTPSLVGLIYSTGQTVLTLPDPASMSSRGYTFLALGDDAYIRLLSPSAPFSTGEDHIAIWQEDRAVRVLSIGDQWLVLDTVSSKPLVLYQWTGYRRGGFVFSDPVPCQDGGNAPARYGNYRIFISTSSVPVADLAVEYGIPTDVPVLSKTGYKVADDWADLTDGSIEQTLLAAGVTPVSSYFWTGGLDAASACTDWTTTTGSGTIGYEDATDTDWINYTTQPCDYNRALLCVAWP